MTRRGCITVCLVALCASSLASAGSPSATTRTPERDAVESTGELEGSELYLAQVVAMFGAESLLAPLSLCPATAWGASLLSPGLGVLALDWVGREMGHMAGSQVAAMLASYGLGCGGGLAVGTGSVVFLVPAYIGVLALAGGSAATGGLLLLSLPGAALCGFGLVTLMARPFVVPWAWRSFASEKPRAAGPEGVAY